MNLNSPLTTSLVEKALKQLEDQQQEGKNFNFFNLLCSRRSRNEFQRECSSPL